MNCKEARDLMEDALDGALPGDVGRELDRHLQVCKECRAAYDAEKAEFGRWRAALKDVGRAHALPADFADRLVAAVERDERERRTFWTRGKAPLLKIAAAFAVTLGFAVAIFNAGVADRMPEPQSATPYIAACAGLSSSDIGLRCEGMASLLEKTVSRSAATQFMANVCAVEGI